MVLVGNSRVYTSSRAATAPGFPLAFTPASPKNAPDQRPKKADVMAVADAWNVTGNAERDLLPLQISERPGAPTSGQQSAQAGGDVLRRRTAQRAGAAGGLQRAGGVMKANPQPTTFYGVTTDQNWTHVHLLERPQGPRGETQ